MQQSPNLISMTEQWNRGIIKDITWLLIASTNTILIAWLITGQISLALEIGGAEVFIKIVFLYLHERFWSKIDYGMEEAKTGNNKMARKAERFRSILKGITWRSIGTINLVIITTALTGNYKIAVVLGLLTVSSRIVLYFIHYLIWNKIDVSSKAKNSKNVEKYIIDETDQSVLFYN